MTDNDENILSFFFRLALVPTFSGLRDDEITRYIYFVGVVDDIALFPKRYGCNVEIRLMICFFNFFQWLKVCRCREGIFVLYAVEFLEKSLL